MAKITPSKRGDWCSYCKARYGVNNVKGQAQAVWSITSFIHGKVIERHYCFTCAKEAQTWTDGSIWTFKEQLDYREGKQTLDVQLGEL
jgi:hypothetical protein